MHQPSEQLTLFTFERTQTDSVTIPRRWNKIYRSWRGEFEVIRDRKVGKLKQTHFDFSIEIYDSTGSCETVIEITAPLPTLAEANFRETVDRLLAFSVRESLVSDLLSDGIEFDSLAKNDSLTFEDDPVTESLVPDATSNNDSVTAINIYKAKGTARGDRKYFRYTYKEAGKVKHLHIGGGNIHSVLAQSRMQAVQDAILRGQSPKEIKQLIQGFRN